VSRSVGRSRPARRSGRRPRAWLPAEPAQSSRRCRASIRSIGLSGGPRDTSGALPAAERRGLLRGGVGVIPVVAASSISALVTAREAAGRGLRARAAPVSAIGRPAAGWFAGMRTVSSVSCDSRSPEQPGRQNCEGASHLESALGRRLARLGVAQFIFWSSKLMPTNGLTSRSKSSPKPALLNDSSSPDCRVSWI
jgi:hypothetical protein